jgi:hypothetical protein
MNTKQMKNKKGLANMQNVLPDPSIKIDECF